MRGATNGRNCATELRVTITEKRSARVVFIGVLILKRRDRETSIDGSGVGLFPKGTVFCRLRRVPFKVSVS